MTLALSSNIAIIPVSDLTLSRTPSRMYIKDAKNPSCVFRTENYSRNLYDSVPTHIHDTVTLYPKYYINIINTTNATINTTMVVLEH